MNSQHSASESAGVLAWLTGALHSPNGRNSGLGVIRRIDNPSSTLWIIGRQPDPLKEFVVVKMQSSQALYLQEKNALSALSNYSGPTEPYAVPRLLASNDDLNCIAMEWIDGKSVGFAIRSSVSRIASGAKLEQGLRLTNRVGTWLQRLKSRTTEPATGFPKGEMLSRFSELVQLIAISRPGLVSEASQRRLLDTFERCLATSEPEENCLVHYDFWFDHIWKRNDQIVVMDFGRAHMGPAGRDAIQFYCRLFDLTISNPLISKSAGKRLIQSFISGYGDLDLSSSTNRLWQLLTRAEKLAGLVENSGIKRQNMLSTMVLEKAG